MKKWEEHCNSRRAEVAVILGRGPSLGRWIEAGSPIQGDFKIGINHTGLVSKCDYNISRHYFPEYANAPGEWFMPFIHNWEYAEKYSKCSFVRPIFEYHCFIPVAPNFFKPTREDMRDLKTFYTDGGSANCAVELAYYLGASRIVFIGVDGGSGYAPATDGIGGNLGNNYDDLKTKTIEASKRRFGANYSFLEI
jgi:hypothetical protein